MAQCAVENKEWSFGRRENEECSRKNFGLFWVWKVKDFREFFIFFWLLSLRKFPVFSHKFLRIKKQMNQKIPIMTVLDMKKKDNSPKTKSRKRLQNSFCFSPSFSQTLTLEQQDHHLDESFPRFREETTRLFLDGRRKTPFSHCVVNTLQNLSGSVSDYIFTSSIKTRNTHFISKHTQNAVNVETGEENILSWGLGLVSLFKQNKMLKVLPVVPQTSYLPKAPVHCKNIKYYQVFLSSF